jgi:hypothetical protein
MSAFFPGSLAILDIRVPATYAHFSGEQHDHRHAPISYAPMVVLFLKQRSSLRWRKTDATACVVASSVG